MTAEKKRLQQKQRLVDSNYEILLCKYRLLVSHCSKEINRPNYTIPLTEKYYQRTVCADNIN